MVKRRWWWAVASLVALTGCPSESGSGGNGGSGGAGGLGGLGGASGSGGVGATGGVGGSTGGTGGINQMTGGVGGSTGGTGGTLEDVCDPNATPKEGPCKDFAEGTYAMHIVLDTHWGDPPPAFGEPLPVADVGRGNIEIYMMGKIEGVCEDGSGGIGTIKACGTTLPPLFSDVTCNLYQVIFPDSIWDSPNIPTFTTTGMTSGFNVGDTLSLVKETGLVGISLGDKKGTWPTPAEAGTFTCPEGTGQACYPDHDNDGKPGITVNIRNDGAEYKATGCGGLNAKWIWQAAPTELLGGVGYNAATRTETVQIGLRLSVGGEGAIAECSASAGGQGAATADNPESRLYSCQTAAGAECSAPQAQFVDENLPEYTVLNEGEAPPTDLAKPRNQGALDNTPSQGPRTRVVRLGDATQTFSCADVRAANFPAWAPALYASPDYH